MTSIEVSEVIRDSNEVVVDGFWVVCKLAEEKPHVESVHGELSLKASFFSCPAIWAYMWLNMPLQPELKSEYWRGLVRTRSQTL